jgi:hypothetical protein
MLKLDSRTRRAEANFIVLDGRYGGLGTYCSDVCGGNTYFASQQAENLQTTRALGKTTKLALLKNRRMALLE